MATLKQCRAAVQELAGRLAAVDESVRRETAPDRTVSCRLPDLDVTLYGRLHDGNLVDVTTATSDDAPRTTDLGLRLSSDDLIALVAGTLPITEAWASGRLKIDASLRDLLRLRSML